MKTMAIFSRIFAALMLIAAWPETARATVVVSAELRQTASGNPNTYSITLHNNSTAGETFSTFWFAWLPGQDYMGVPPTNVMAPAGWTPNITHGGGADGYAIMFNASPAMAAGTTVSGFTFQSTSTLADLRGNSVFYPSRPVTTSQVFSTPNTTFIVSVADLFNGTIVGANLKLSPWYGYYLYGSYPLVYEYNLGYQYVYDAGGGAVYLYDYRSGHFWYTSPSYFPFLYDYSLGTFLYYYQGNGNPRYFQDYATTPSHVISE
jgi:hypothetical protein